MRLSQVTSLLAAAACFSVMYVTAHADDAAIETATLVFSQDLPNLPGQTLTAVLVSYPPGARSVRHHHAGSVLAYVLTGSIRSENSATGPAQVYQAGQVFFEPPGSHHLISENASTSAPASLLAIFVAADGAVLKTADE
jgi:quercetin dioxygenase-like cupin family protein